MVSGLPKKPASQPKRKRGVKQDTKLPPLTPKPTVNWTNKPAKSKERPKSKSLTLDTEPSTAAQIRAAKPSVNRRAKNRQKPNGNVNNGQLKKKRKLLESISEVAGKVFPFSKLKDADVKEAGMSATVSTHHEEIVEETAAQLTTNSISQNDDFISFDFNNDDVRSIAHSVRSSFTQFEQDLEIVEDSYINDHSDDDDHHNSSNSQFPWIRNQDHANEKEIADWLTLEIKDFVVYMSPSKEEIKARNDAVRRISSVVSNLWEDSETLVFGSYATNLYLPGSDIDIVIISSHGRLDKKSHLYQLSSRLRNSGIGTNIEVIAKARVPIIKFVDAQSKIHIDVSFERRNGISTLQTIQKWMQRYPSLRSFAIVVKHFLARRKLNEVHTGGLGGFSTICLIVSFFANHPRLASGEIEIEDNLGVLLIEFFEFYGKHFNYDRCALKMTGDMCYISKEDYPDMQAQNSYQLAIQDPNDPTNNLARSSFNTRGLKKAFAGAYELLIARCYELETLSFKNRIGKSILGNVLKVNGPKRHFIDYSDKIRNIAIRPQGGGQTVITDLKRKRTEYLEEPDMDSDVDFDGVVTNAKGHLKYLDSDSDRDVDSLPDRSSDDESDSRLSQIKNLKESKR